MRNAVKWRVMNEISFTVLIYISSCSESILLFIMINLLQASSICRRIIGKICHCTIRLPKRQDPDKSLLTSVSDIFFKPQSRIFDIFITFFFPGSVADYQAGIGFPCVFCDVHVVVGDAIRLA